MLLKKDFHQQSVRNVHMGNGSIAFRGFNMNVYTFITDGVLIDTGAKTLEKEFLAFFQQHEIDRVVITHYHEDHTGSASVLQERFGLPIFMSEKKRDDCRRKADYPLYRKLFWGKRHPFHAQAIESTFSSRHFTWEVIETPGHAIDHLAFYNRDTGQLFSGDLFCQVKTKVVLREESIPTVIESLKNVLTYDFQEVFCNHAGYIKEGRKALQRKLEYLQELQGKILKLYEEGMTPDEITNQLFPKKYPITLLSSGEWSSRNIVNSVIQDKLGK